MAPGAYICKPRYWLGRAVGYIRLWLNCRGAGADKRQMSIDQIAVVHAVVRSYSSNVPSTMSHGCWARPNLTSG
jgi:hypothetical protein